MDTEPAVSYRAAVPGTPVLTRSGTEIGTLEHVLGVPEEDLFDGLVVATEWGLRFVDASEVELITVRHVRSRLDDDRWRRITRSDRRRCRPNAGRRRRNRGGGRFIAGAERARLNSQRISSKR